jgi:uroporphyrinogen decarboxylase
MNSRERVLRALNHQEPDCVPFDLGGTGLSSIHITAYQNLRRYVDLVKTPSRLSHIAEQLTMVDEDLAAQLEVDIRPVMPGLSSEFEYIFRGEGPYEAYTDEWGIGWHKPNVGGLYYDMYKHPLADADSLEDFKNYPFPNPLDDGRYKALRSQAEGAVAKGKAVVLAGPCAGITEVYSWLRGYEQYYIDLAINQEYVACLLDRLVEFKCAYWKRALEEIGDLVDVVIEADDLASQNALLLSPKTYRSLIKPHHQRLFSFIKDQDPVKVFFHSCGAIRPLIGDLIDTGIDILNPVQMSAKGMNLRELKQEFGQDVVFWGGGVDTQGVLSRGTPEQVREDVKRNIEALAPGGGFIFAAVHDIQADVPPENILVMWEAWREYGIYSK